jgi:hypothetical protein
MAGQSPRIGPPSRLHGRVVPARCAVSRCAEGALRVHQRSVTGIIQECVPIEETGTRRGWGRVWQGRYAQRPLGRLCDRGKTCKPAYRKRTYPLVPSGCSRPSLLGLPRVSCLCRAGEDRPSRVRVPGQGFSCRNPASMRLPQAVVLPSPARPPCASDAERCASACTPPARGANNRAAVGGQDWPTHDARAPVPLGLSPPAREARRSSRGTL